MLLGKILKSFSTKWNLQWDSNKFGNAYILLDDLGILRVTPFQNEKILIHSDICLLSQDINKREQFLKGLLQISGGMVLKYSGTVCLSSRKDKVILYRVLSQISLNLPVFENALEDFLNFLEVLRSFCIENGQEVVNKNGE